MSQFHLERKNGGNVSHLNSLCTTHSITESINTKDWPLQSKLNSLSYVIIISSGKDEMSS